MAIEKRILFVDRITNLLEYDVVKRKPTKDKQWQKSKWVAVAWRRNHRRTHYSCNRFRKGEDPKNTARVTFEHTALYVERWSYQNAMIVKTEEMLA